MDKILISSIFFPLLTLFSILLSSLYFTKQKQPHNNNNHGFKSYPILGTLPHFLANRHRFLDWSTDVLSADPAHTAVFFRPGKVHGIITANPSTVEHVLKTRFENYPKGPRVATLLHDFLGTGIFNSDGNAWRLQRKIASFEFNKRSLKNFVLESVRVEIISRFIPILKEYSSGLDRVFDLQDILERFAFDNVCKLAFDFDPGCLAGHGSGQSGFMRAFEEATTLSAGRFFYALPMGWKIKRILNIDSEKRLRESINIVHGFANKIIQRRLEEITRESNSNNNSNSINHQDLLSRFMFSNESSDIRGQDCNFLRDVVISFILAGRDTTSSGLSWFFWLLANNPDVLTKIRSEVSGVRIKAGKQVGDTYDYDELMEMSYLHAALSETLRLYPPVPVDTRVCLEDDVLPDGTEIKKDWFITYHTYAMGRMESIWGKDCLEFRPERWIDENGLYKPSNPFKYPVFHAGPRICLGKEMAYLQMKSIAACVVEQFDVDVVDKEKRPDYLLALTLRMKNGLHKNMEKTDPFFLFITFFFIPILYYFIQILFFKPKTIISSFNKYPILGTIPDFVLNRHCFLEWTTRILSSHPTHTAVFYRAAGGAHGVLTADPANIEHILKTRFENYPKGPRFLSILHDFLGTGIFNADGPVWRMQRKTASFAFNMRALKNFLLNSVQVEITSRLIPILKDASRSNKVLDLQDILERFAFDNVCKLAFNVDPCCLNQCGSSELEFMRAFDEATELSSGRFLAALPIWWKIKKFFDFGSEKKLKEAIKIVHEFADNIIQSRLEEKLSRKNDYNDLLSRFLDTFIEDNEDYNNLNSSSSSSSSSTKFLRDVVISVILAGKDTTSTGLSWLFWLLSLNPDVVEKIRAEIDWIRVQSKKSVGSNYDYEDLQEMHYLHAVISESLRLYPPVPVDTKACLEDDILPDGSKIKKGWFIMYHIYAIARVEDIWGNDCCEFKPERWLENGVFKPDNLFRYPVFHAGPRVCLGKEMAYIQMKSIVASVLEQFDVDVLGKEKHPDYLLSLTLRMKNGLP
ncbi:Cytochrome P450 94A1, partial [Bienertia sinuspersici]